MEKEQQDEQLGMLDKTYNWLKQRDYQGFVEWLGEKEERKDQERYKSLWQGTILLFVGAMAGSMGLFGLLLIPVVILGGAALLYKEEQSEA